MSLVEVVREKTGSAAGAGPGPVPGSFAAADLQDGRQRRNTLVQGGKCGPLRSPRDSRVVEGEIPRSLSGSAFPRGEKSVAKVGN